MQETTLHPSGCAFLVPIQNYFIIPSSQEGAKGKIMEGSTLYVGNLTYSVTEEQIKELFSNYGEVKEVRIIERKGFGFVEMSSPEEAEKAKEELSGTVFEGRTLRIDEARPPRPRREFRRF
jgi:RNA recognition motif-containing protein